MKNTLIQSIIVSLFSVLAVSGVHADDEKKYPGWEAYDMEALLGHYQTREQILGIEPEPPKSSKPADFVGHEDKPWRNTDNPHHAIEMFHEHHKMKKAKAEWELEFLEKHGLAGASLAEHGLDGAIQEAVQQYQQGEVPPIVKHSGRVVFPFGESQPVVKCSPLRACDIELRAGEVITGVALGDAERWIASPLESGDPAAPTPHIILKPKAYDLATNVVIGTTERTYHIGLVSPAMDEVKSGALAYHRQVSFYYPAELVERWATAERLAKARTVERQQAAERRVEQRVTGLGVTDLEGLSFEYEVKAETRRGWRFWKKKKRQPAFTPSSVFDDGQHVYIRLPEKARTADLPALVVLTEDGEAMVSNYRVLGDWYVVDGVFDQAELVLGVGKHRQRVEIVRTLGG